MKINFLLPVVKQEPVGGYKVIYEYANRLANDGHEVCIIYPNNIKIKNKRRGLILRYVKAYFKYLKLKKNQKYTANAWFPLDERVKEILSFTLDEKYIPDADICFATAWRTAVELNKYHKEKGEKYYLIQSFEDWDGPLEEVVSTWKMPLKKIVISESLKRKAKELSEKAILIENGLDFNIFYKENIEKKENQLIMLYHKNEEVKQSKKALKIIINLKKEIPQLELVLFSTEEKPKQLPKWISYYQMPNQELLRKLYSESSIFVGPSKREGWALPPAEAMQCETCVCVTDISGHEYIKHLETGYKIKDDLTDLEDTIKLLLSDKDLRGRLAKMGNENIQQFTWERAYKKLKEII